MEPTHRLSRAIMSLRRAAHLARCAQNDKRMILTISRAAFATSDESLKIDLLRLLVGVEWPTASRLLHFCDERPYPILDYRALWSLGHAKTPHYTMEFWLEYLACTRGLTTRLKHDIRTIARALWQYSKRVCAGHFSMANSAAPAC